MPNNKERKLKIQPRFFPRQWKDAVFPEIRLAGKWLEDLGFTCGKFVIILQQENKIIITVHQEAQQEPATPKKSTGKKAKVIPLVAANAPAAQLFHIHSGPGTNGNTIA